MLHPVLHVPVREATYRPACHRTRYRSESSALLALDPHTRTTVDPPVYPCPFCHGWHHTTERRP